MEWSDRGTVLGARKHGETSLILEVMTEHHGRHLGLVRGGRTGKQRSVLQPGNDLALMWRARLDEHLGTFTPELLASRTGRLIEDRLSLSAFQMTGHLLRLLPEREENTQLFHALTVICDSFDEPTLLAELLIRLELSLLNVLGFGLDLTNCAKTGQQADLVYVSPKSGRAVSATAGQRWHNQLLRLPPFLTPSGQVHSLRTLSDLEDGFRLSGFFLERHVYAPRQMIVPQCRFDTLSIITSRLSKGEP